MRRVLLLIKEDRFMNTTYCRDKIDLILRNNGRYKISIKPDTGPCFNYLALIRLFLPPYLQSRPPLICIGYVMTAS